jgi:LPXTG-motif cell wall-anchored protein
MWARRLIIGSGFAVASLTMLSGAAGAAGCASAGSMTQPGCVVPPNAAGGAQGVAPASLPRDPTPAKVTPVSTGPTSLPFTGADIEELAVVGAGAVLAGGLLLRRRRHTLA